MAGITDSGPSSAVPARAWPGERLRGAPRRVFMIFVAVDVVAVAAWLIAVAVGAHSLRAVGRLALLFVLCVVFEEIARQTGRARLQIRTGAVADMTSVWIFAGLIVMPAGYAGMLIVAIALWVWGVRVQGPKPLVFRKVYTAAATLIAGVAGSLLLAHMGDHFTAIPSGPRAAMVIAVALVVFTVVNHLLITLAAVLLYGSWRMALGSWEDNALELATLCLGALVALTVMYEPWLT
ncbi:MAG: hypothetical protein FWD74_10165, partial [Actinomycetia bacterium]|nr:hypothetical protein [Actinomycetes bacterium]